jgi:thiol-disulfide isomerase/thioredoxin
VKTASTVNIFIFMLLVEVAIASAASLPPGVMRINALPAPALSLDTIDGDSYELSATKGHWRFVHFWATWCGPCRREMPSIQRMMTRLGDVDIEVVLVNTAETEDEVFTFLGIVAPDLLPLMDSDGLVTELWQPRGLPATFLVDPSGLIQYQALGGREWEKPEYLEFLRGLDSADQGKQP